MIYHARFQCPDLPQVRGSEDTVMRGIEHPQVAGLHAGEVRIHFTSPSLFVHSFDECVLQTCSVPGPKVDFEEYE